MSVSQTVQKMNPSLKFKELGWNFTIHSECWFNIFSKQVWVDCVLRVFLVFLGYHVPHRIAEEDYRKGTRS